MAIQTQLVALLLAGLVALAATVALLALVVPLRLQPRRHSVFVRAPAQTVWDTYFMHVRRAEYRPGRRILDIETLSREPLTVRATIHMDYASAPDVVTYCFPVYDPPHRYRMEIMRRRDGSEEGELEEQDGGTWLRCTMQVPRMPLLLAWFAGQRTRENLRALAVYCEGGTPPPKRPPIRWTWWEGPLAFGSIALAAVGAPVEIWSPLLAIAGGVGAWRGWQLARRLMAL